jgi:hypothetical protein
MDIKYLSDGRKVAVVGKLNNIETIVQEIFVTKSGDEIPGGERFVTKSLHDEPVISYAEKEKKELETQVAKWRRQSEDARRDYNQCYAKLQGIQAALYSASQFKAALSKNDLEVFTKFVTGTIEYLVIDSYSINPPVKLIDKIIDFESNSGRSYDAVRLLSVMGRSNGELGYNLHQYYDGSGSSTEVYPFTDLADAIAHIKARALGKIEKGYLSLEDYEKCIAMGIVFDSSETDKFKQKLLSDMQTTDKSYSDDYAKKRAELDDRKKRLESI